MAREQPVTVVVIGPGLRGRFTYGRLALADPRRLQVVEIAREVASA